MAKVEKSNKSRGFREPREFDQRVVDVARVSRVVKGGKRFRFRALVVVGNRKGKVGFALAKGADVSAAVNKAAEHAKKNLVQVPLKGTTIPYQVNVKSGSAKVLLKPAVKGKGVIAGGSVRVVMDMAGVKDIVAKMMGSQNKINNVKAVFKAMEKIAILDGKYRTRKAKNSNTKVQSNTAKK